MAQADKSDNKTKILDCALDLFYEKGYEGVGVQEIAQSAGITKPTLYYYYKSKYGLLESVLEQYVPGYIKNLDDARVKSNGLEDCLYNVAREYVCQGIGNKKFFYMFLNLQYSPKESDSHKAVNRYTVGFFDVFLKIFTEHETLLGNMNGRQEQFAMGFMGILNYYLLVFYEKENTGKSIKANEKEIFSLVHQFMHGIFS